MAALWLARLVVFFFLSLGSGYIGFTRETLSTNKNTGKQRTVRITKVIESTDPGKGKRKKSPFVITHGLPDLNPCPVKSSIDNLDV